MAGMPVHQAPISAFLHSQVESWPLRLIASGKPVAVEVFRSKQEAVFHSLLAKQMRDNQPRVELNEVVKFIHQKHGHEITAGSSVLADLNDWAYRFKVLNHLAKLTAQRMTTMLPITESQDMMRRMQELQEECNQLRQNAQGVAGNPPPIVPPAQALPAA